MGWKIIFVFLALVGLAGASTYSDMAATDALGGWAVMMALIVFLAVICFRKGFLGRSTLPRRSPLRIEPDNQIGLSKQEMKRRHEIHLSDEQLIDIREGRLPELTEQQLLLQGGESARYSCNAVLLITKQKAIGRTGGGGGVSVRVAKGVSLHSGGGSSRTIYGDVTERYAGRLVITDKRVVFLQQQKGFEQSIGKLTAMTPYLDGMDLQFGNKPYSLSVIAARYPVAVLRLILNGAGEEVIEEE